MRCVPPLAFLFLLSLNSVLRAQSTSASITGRVTDPSDAVIGDVRVTAISADTNARHETTTTATGEYYLTNLLPGSYRIEVEKPGFKKVIKPDVILHVQDALELGFELTLGSVSETVTVEAGAPLLDTRSGTVGTVIDRAFVESLPLNGRSFQSLITITPGVVLTPASASSPGQFSINGQRSDANHFMVDGVSANVDVFSGTALRVQSAGATPGFSAQGGTNSLVSVDAMQEFRIQSSSYAPEFGRTPGGQISIVTRSGTNQFHGSLFEYFRNDALDSTDYFVERQGLSKPREHQNDFGAVFGGPLQRDRTFLFVSYEGLRLDQPRSAVTEVPSLASRAAASDALKPIFAALPLPNGSATANGFAQFSASYTDPSTLNATSIRVDHTFGPALSVFGRYNYAPSQASSRLGSFAVASANTVGVLHNGLQTLTAGGTWIVNSRMSNELRLNWSRNLGKNFSTIDTFGGAILPSAELLHPAYAGGESTYQLILGGTDAGFVDGLNADNIQRQLNIVDGVLLTRARHQMKFGIDYRRLFPVYGPVPYAQAYLFNGAAGALTGIAPVAVVGTFSGSNRSPRLTNFSAYGQDTWLLSSSLSAMYGMRWEVNPPPRLNNSNEALTLQTSNPAALALAPPGTSMYRTTYNNLAPRVGAAYQLRRDTGREMVVRGGWGIFFDLGTGPLLDNFVSFPFVARRLLINAPFPTDPALLAPPTVAPGAPVDFLTAADPDLKLPYTQEWNVSVEQALGVSSTVSATYVGAVGRRLLRDEQLVNPTPQFQNLTLVTNEGHSRYNALQMKYVRRLSGGLRALASYTLANSKDNTSNDTIPVLPSVRVNPDADWAPSDFDVRHTLTGGLTYAVPAPGSESVWHPILRNWSLDAAFTFRSSLPVDVVTGTTAFGVSNALRPDIVPGEPLYMADPNVPGGQRFNPAAFTSPPLDASGNPVRQGTLMRNALRGFAARQVDLAIRRDVPMGPNVTLQLGVEAFNVFNTVNLGQPINSLSSGLFGQATRTLASSLGAGGVAGGGFSPLYQLGGPRSIQLALRLQY